MTTNIKSRVGFVGLGAMGGPMASQIFDAGFDITGFDVNPTALGNFAAKGADVSATVADVAEGCDILVVMVVSATQVEDILFGPDGAVHKLAFGSIVWVASTVPPEFARDIAVRLEGLGLTLIDGPVSGGALGAQEGTLSVMASGPAEAIVRARPVLEAVSKDVFVVGSEAGSGSVIKMINQLFVGSHLALCAEAIGLAKRAGVEIDTMLDVVGSSAGSSKILKWLLPKVVSGDHFPHSSIDIYLKDLSIVTDSAKTLRSPNPVSSAALQVFTAAAARGWGAKSETTLYALYEPDEVLADRAT